MYISIPDFLLKRPLYVQILFTVFAFLLMIILSYVFTGRIVRDNLVRNVNSVLDLAEAQINSDLLESRTILDDFAQSMRSLIMRGDDAAKLTAYNKDISAHLLSKKRDTFSSNGPFGYIEKLPGGPSFINGIGWEAPDDFIPIDRPWYSAAIEAGGNVAETIPYKDTVTGETVLTYSRGIFDDNGARLGVVAIDVRAGHIGDKVVKTVFTKDSYGVLISQDLTLIGHPNPEFVGLKMDDPRIPLSILADELLRTGEIFEVEFDNWKGETNIAFYRTLANGWRLGVMAPQKRYYQPVTDMAMILSLLGVTLASDYHSYPR